MWVRAQDRKSIHKVVSLYVEDTTIIGQLDMGDYPRKDLARYKSPEQAQSVFESITDLSKVITLAY